jgi:hypothetical protein
MMHILYVLLKKLGNYCYLTLFWILLTLFACDSNLKGKFVLFLTNVSVFGNVCDLLTFHNLAYGTMTISN